jgi:hypothetical protein
VAAAVSDDGAGWDNAPAWWFAVLVGLTVLVCLGVGHAIGW